MRGSRPTPSLRQRALMWLAQREHSRRELQDKLLRWVKALEATQALATAARAPSADGSACARSPSLSGAPVSLSQPALPDASQIAALLDDLEAAGHLSNERVLESRIQVRSARFGNLRIERELQHLGVEPSPEARHELRRTEQTRARSVWERKFGATPSSPAERARQMRFLASRGFSAETIRAVLNQQTEDTAGDEGID